MTDRRAVARFARNVACALPMLLFPVAVNYLVDPANLFVHPGVQEQRIADHLLAGLNVTNWEFYDDRLIQRDVIVGLAHAPETIVLGSSRAMLIGDRTRPGWHIRNHCVAGASIEEYLGFYDQYRRRGLFPRRIVIGVDPWVLNENDNLNRWLPMKADVDEMVRLLDERPWDAKSTEDGPISARRREGPSNLLNLLSLDYFQQSLQLLFRRRPRYEATPHEINDDFTKLADGTMTNAKPVRERTPDGVLREAQQYVEAGKSLYLLADFDRLSPRNEQTFGRLVDYMRSHGEEVILYLPPYHPFVYAHIRSHPQYARVMEAERWLREFAAARHLVLIGSYDPGALGLGNADFLDGHHLQQATVTRILTRLS